MISKRDAFVRERASGKRILEVVFVGKHDGRDGPEMGCYLRNQMELHAPDAVVINILAFKYSTGNDMGDLLFPVLKKLFCIIAKGRTARSLQSLFGVTRLPQFVDACYFTDPEEGFQHLERELDGETG